MGIIVNKDLSARIDRRVEPERWAKVCVGYLLLTGYVGQLVRWGRVAEARRLAEQSKALHAQLWW